jgi:hypothetical protein
MDRLVDQVLTQLGQVGSLQIDHPGVATKRPSELPGRGAEVEYDQPANLKAEAIEGMGKLDPPTQRSSPEKPDGGIASHQRERVGDHGTVHQHVALVDQLCWIVEFGEATT